MPINFGQNVFQPRALNYEGIFSGLDTIIEGNRERKRLAQNESQFARSRSDNQATNAANFAEKTGESAYKTESERYQKQRTLIDQARAAAQAGNYNAVRALIPGILQLGGQASESGDPGAPDFLLKEGGAPSRSPLDFAGARRQIYGPSSPEVSAPFQVPGFGPSGQRNPMDPPALPGTSAAAMPSGSSPSQTQSPPPAAAGAQPSAEALDPPPGPARSVAPEGAVWLPPGVDPGTAPAESSPSSGATEAPPQAPQAAQPVSLQDGPNPFDPYVIRTADVQANNDLQLEPFFRGLKNAAPSRYASQIDQFGQGARALNLSPIATLETTRPWSDQLIRMFNSEVTAEGQAGRAAATATQRQSVQDDKNRKDARGFASKIIQVNNLQDTKKKSAATREAALLATRALTNGSVANALIETLYKMRNTGVMTDVDFSRTESGIQSLAGSIVNNTLKQFINANGGLHPGMVRRIQELIRLTEQAHRATMMDAMGSFYEAYQGAQSQAARDVYEENMRVFFPREMLPEEFTSGRVSQEQLPTYDPRETGQFDTTGEPPVPLDTSDGPSPLGFDTGSSDNLGVVPLPKEPNRTGAQRGSRVPPKPPRKAIKDMTPEERRARGRELLEKARQP